MKRSNRTYVCAATLVAGSAWLFVGCNSHLLVEAGKPEVVVIDPPPVPPPPQIQLSDAGLPTTLFPPVTLGDLPDGAVPDAYQPPVPDAPPKRDAAPDGYKEPDLPPPSKPDSAPDLSPDLPPVENLKCPSGQVRVHFRDVWSAQVDPTMKTMTAPPLGVMFIDPSVWSTYGGRVDGIDCTYYSVCLPSTIGKIQVKPIGADGCANSGQSGNFDISSLNKNPDIWIEYNGQSSTLQADYSAGTVGSGKFNITSDSTKLTHPACQAGAPPNQGVPEGYTKVHFRWPWNDPTDPKTPYPGSGCPVASAQRDPVTKACPFDLAKTVGFSVPPYPSSLKVTGLTCEMVAVLEFQDGLCPWYVVMIPNSAWPTTGTAPKIVFRYPEEAKQLYTNSIQLPQRTANEYWIAYAGAPDNTIASGTCCMDWSLQTNSYFVYTENPGPGYPGCGGNVKPVDPCSPPQPTGYHTVHFRYLWAGQKTFSFFPKPALMPKWIELEVNGPGNALKVICQREQDRPWFECPVPDSAFSDSTTWRAVDKLHSPEWNTVKPWPLPKEPKEYWIRWYYGKPDIPREKDPPNFKVFDYYPDGTNGDWSATGVWNDDMCAPKPPATPVNVGFGNGAWFPYKRTQYMYPYGGSLSYIYPPENREAVQDLFDAFVWERYQLWKQNWVRVDAEACGSGTARVDSGGWPGGTVSEGQGYGIAMAAAIGDKDLVTKLWEFIRYFRTQARYCGLMGWKWDDAGDCQSRDSFASNGGNLDSAFDGDVDIAIGLVYAALQWPEFTAAAVDWLVRMECEVNTKYGDGWNYPTKGDTWNKNCQNADKCDYESKTNSEVFMDYYPPGYFRVFGDFLAANPPSSGDQATNGQTHKEFWYKTAETVWEMVERCYDQAGMHVGLISQSGNAMKPCENVGGGEPYEWGRALWRLGIDAAWFGNNTSLPEAKPNSSPHYAGKSRIQAKIDQTQMFFNDFHIKNPVEPNTNRFSSICHQLGPSGAVTNCDSAYGHNSYTVNLALCPYVSVFDGEGKTTSDIRREAIEESITTTVQNDQYFQESLGVYSILFMTGNFPNPLTVPK
jgi:hypothetical protein